MKTGPELNPRCTPLVTRPAGPASSEERLAWYRERDHDPEDLHRRYVRAKFQMSEWTDADLARFHRYRRSVPREQAARLVLARRYGLIGLTAFALAALIASLIYAAFQWGKRQSSHRALPPAPSARRRPEMSS